MHAIIGLALIALALFWVIGVYNGLVKARNNCRNAFAQIDVQLQRRYDLIPNLVETAKGYLKHERETLEAVTAARSGAVAGLKAAQANPGAPEAMRQLSAAESVLAGALARLQVTMESYPELKADQNMRQLSEELASTENRVAFARQAFNDGVMSYNNRRETFPQGFFANLFGFQAVQALAVDAPEARGNVKVSFG